MKLLQTFAQADGGRRYRVAVPDFIAGHEDFPHYEKDRFASMEANLCRGDTLFDVGAELGWQSAIYASFVGGSSMCLFEPAAELWPTIKQVWWANHLDVPRAICRALVSNRTCGDADVHIQGWSVAAQGEPLTSYDNWAAIHSFTVSGGLAEISLDDFVDRYGIAPTAITVDVEGAEDRVLRGAAEILRRLRPLAWVSLHADARLAKYGTSKAAVRAFMRGLNYLEQYLGVDHEEHSFFYPCERADRVILVASPWATHGKRGVSFEEAIPGWRDPWTAERATWGAD